VLRLEKLRPDLNARLAPEAVERLARSVAHYEFELAVTLLLELAKEAGMSIDAEAASTEVTP
jgi:hypothetical protein